MSLGKPNLTTSVTYRQHFPPVKRTLFFQNIITTNKQKTLFIWRLISIERKKQDLIDGRSSPTTARRCLFTNNKRRWSSSLLTRKKRTKFQQVFFFISKTDFVFQNKTKFSNSLSLSPSHFCFAEINWASVEEWITRFIERQVFREWRIQWN